jgi:hypothetical protein
MREFNKHTKTLQNDKDPFQVMIQALREIAISTQRICMLEEDRRKLQMRIAEIESCSPKQLSS